MLARLRSVSILERHAIALVSMVVGTDWLLENDSNFRAPVYDAPRAVVRDLPWLHGMQWWGVAFLLGGLMMLVTRHPLVRLVFISGGVGSWLAIGFAAGYDGTMSPQVSMVFGVISLFFAARLLQLAAELRLPVKMVPVEEDEVGRVHLRCPYDGCEEDLPVPVRLRLVSVPGSDQTVETEPDLSEVWSHAWTHDEESK